MAHPPKSICPFCNKSFKLDVAEGELLDTYHPCPCSCGAMICLCLEDDTAETMAELEASAGEIQTVERFDGLSVSEDDRVDTWITAIFWKN